MRVYGDTYRDNGQLKGGFFNGKEFLEENIKSSLYIILGPRGVGKSYGVKLDCLRESLGKKHNKFVYVRKNTNDLTTRMLSSVFEDISSNTIKDILKEEGTLKDYKDYEEFYIGCKSQRFYLVGMNGVGKKDTILTEIGVATCLTQATRFKNTSVGSASRIILDEFISDKVNTDKDVDAFSKIINTIGRVRNSSLKIFMLGNPDKEYTMAADAFLQSYHIDWRHIQKDTVYLFDSKVLSDVGTSKIIANNVAFIYLNGCVVNGERVNYLNESTSSLFGSSEERMALTSAYKEDSYLRFDAIQDDFEPMYELCLQTPQIATDSYRKCLWIYLGINNRTEYPCLVVLSHRLPAGFDLPHICSRYDKDIFIRSKDPNTLDIYRLDFPKIDSPMFKQFFKMWSFCIIGKLLYTDKNGNLDMFLSMLDE